MIGYSYFESEGYFWKTNQNVIMPLSMPHVLNSMDEIRARKILNNSRAWMIRWEEGFDSDHITNWWHVIKDSSEDISELPKKTRYMIRKAADVYFVEKWDREKVASECYPVYCASFLRYDTHERMFTSEDFRNAVETAPEETEFWVVLRRDNRKVVGFAEDVLRDNACFYASVWLVPEEMKHFSGYLLFHEMNKYYLNDLNVKYVSDGARSISHKTEIHEYLISKFKFRKAYARLHVVYRPWFYVVVKALYPMRNIIKKIPLHILSKVTVVLKQEAIRKTFITKAERK